MVIRDKAGKKYWDDCWVKNEIPSEINPHDKGFRNYSNRQFHKLFFKVFSDIETGGMRLLEIGCARSAWLPYFAKEFNFKVSGIDYSEIGCQQARANLLNTGVEGDIICANAFSPPEKLLNAFDVVVSFGVVEHFEDTATCLAAFSRFLKPKGIIITIIPNLVGLNGLIQKLVNRPIFDIHVPLDLNQLVKAHKIVSLDILNCGYFLSVHFGVSNLNGLDPQSTLTRLKGFVLSNLTRFGKAIWLIEDNLIPFKATKFLSPYIIIFGKKK